MAHLGTPCVFMGDRIDLHQRPPSSSPPSPPPSSISSSSTGAAPSDEDERVSSAEEEVTGILSGMVEDVGVLEELLPDDVGHLHYPGLAHYLLQVRANLAAIRALRDSAVAYRAATAATGVSGASGVWMLGPVGG
jgi:hypothetical protein